VFSHGLDPKQSSQHEWVIRQGSTHSRFYELRNAGFAPYGGCDAFADILCNAYATVESARQAEQIDEQLFNTMCQDLDVALQRWPKIIIPDSLGLPLHDAFEVFTGIHHLYWFTGLALLKEWGEPRIAPVSKKQRSSIMRNALAALIIVFAIPTAVRAQALTPEEELGKSIFFDTDLSFVLNQACAACHGPEAGWTGPISDINTAGAVYEGSIAGRFGNRKPPSSAYATQSPIFHFVRQGGGAFVGGNFWDGRATGEKLGNPAADQAQGPFLNPVEQALPDNACVVYRVCQQNSYPYSFQLVWEDEACDIAWPNDVDTVCATEGGTVELSPVDAEKVDAAYDNIARSIASYEASTEVNAFSSKYDAYLAGLVDLTAQENKGLRLFKGKAKCSRCHIEKIDNKTDEPPLFTDFTFDNLGVPRNPENPWYTQPFNPDGLDWVDEGLGGFLATRAEYADRAEEHRGAQKVPTLRNVDLRPELGFVKAYAHNGYFKTLEGIVHFYNTRDVLPTCADPFTTEADALAMNCWPEPEIPENVNTKELGDLKLSAEDEADIVAFLKTLSDGVVAPAAP
jgi:cytochrome c peroxidase